ncbi:MAG: class I SAM-dependent methyltransferase [Micromonosporaceae bacterium]
MTSSPPTAALDPEKLDELRGRFVNDLGAAFHAVNAVVGDRLGLYAALAETGPASPEEVATRAGCDPRSVREWLRAQAAGGYVTYDPQSERYSLSPEQAFALADPYGMSLPGAFLGVTATAKTEPVITESFRAGSGVPWGKQHQDLFPGTARFFGAGYAAELVPSWIPAPEGVEEKLRTGARVADVGCGYGISTILMAQAYPNSSFAGFDIHEGSIEAALRRAAAEGIAGRISFKVAAADAYPAREFDLVTVFDAFHDMGDPVGVARHALASLKPDGTLMLVEPRAGDQVEDNFNPVGRLFYNASALICVPNSVSQDVGTALGAQAGEARLREVLTEAGFTSVRGATDTPFNMIIEARP